MVWARWVWGLERCFAVNFFFLTVTPSIFLAVAADVANLFH